MNDTPIGATVVTSDGEEMGRVKEMEGECFKVDAPLQPDYWLGPDVVDVATPTTVQLLFTKNELASVVRPSTSHSGYHIHTD